jgi:hypothetical protein
MKRRDAGGLRRAAPARSRPDSSPAAPIRTEPR